MNQPFNQSVTFVLDKAHFQECFEQSAPPVQARDYGKAVIFGLAAFASIFVETEHYYILFFLIGLAILELFSIRYRQTWWVWRQLMGKSANGRVKLIINEEGITTESTYVNSQILWPDVSAVEQTEKGLLLRHQGGVNYLSNSHLSDEIVAFILLHDKKASIENT
ncbi:YcxB family protein [Aliikangiella coralliicola]|uniref:YcxB family protein n=1 Tax=Aliikangiella coralliicola TaxID=2592383 RepID=A0A545UDP9_9GAMM|nr:YcxB family protein [Aliikangiella coralliicola]TQV87592.1 YcxB family protein [Aliikangiella coralliicola]